MENTPHTPKYTLDMIKDWRKSRNWTQADLAEALGVDQSLVSKLEKGREATGPVKKLLERLMSEPIPALPGQEIKEETA